MKTLTALMLIALAAVSLIGQAKPTSEADYNGTFQNAVSETNAAFPFVFTVVTETYKNGKLLSTETEVDERQAEGVERETKTLERGGKTLRSYSVMLGFDGKTYCSSDGKSWNGPQENVCLDPDGTIMLRLSLPQKPESAQYTVTDTTLDGQPVKIYRKYAVFPANGPKARKTYEDETATLDSRGFFISVIKKEGTLAPESVTSINKQTWDFKTKIKPIVAPK